MSKKALKLVIICGIFLLSVACGKEEAKQEQKGIQGTWKNTQTLECGTTINRDQSKATVMSITDKTINYRINADINCFIDGLVTVTHKSGSFVEDTMVSLKIVPFFAEGCKKADVKQSDLDKDAKSYSSRTFEYTFDNPNQLTIKTDDTCKKSDGTKDFIREVYARQ